jgi:hypothetical protein
MSTLTVTDRAYLEKFLDMSGGYPHRYPGEKFSDNSFGALFQRHSIDIHGTKYQTHGTSKANKLRAFWDIENDSVVGKVMAGMVDEYVVGCELNNRNADATLLEKVRGIVSRLNGTPQTAKSARTADDFLNYEFTIPSVRKLPIEAQAIPIIDSRLAEARKALGAGAHLSVIFLCGSVLEAVLLGAAQKGPESFNRASASPKANDGSVKRFHEWSLAQLIDVSCEIGLLKPDVKKFSHGLRDFRNYIHPYEQMISSFTPDEHTAKVCFQVLKAALASVAGERK